MMKKLLKIFMNFMAMASLHQMAAACAPTSKEKLEKESCVRQSSHSTPAPIASSSEPSASTQAPLLHVQQQDEQPLSLAQMRALRKESEERIKNTTLTDDEIKKILTPSDPRFAKIYTAIEEGNFSDLEAVDNLDELLLMQDPSGYTPLLHAVYQDRPYAFMLLQKMLELFLTKMQKKEISQDFNQLNQLLNAKIKGLNAYEFAAFLERRDSKAATKKYDNLLHLKVILRSLLANDLPHSFVLVPKDLIPKFHLGPLNSQDLKLLAFIDSHNPNNTVFLLASNVSLFSLYYNLRSSDIFQSASAQLKNELLKRNVNVRYALPKILNLYILELHKTSTMFERLIDIALEQGEPLENIEEIYESFKSQAYNKLKHQYEAFKDILDKRKKARFEKELNEAQTANQPIIDLKQAIEKFKESYEEPDLAQKAIDHRRLQEALGKNDENISLQDDEGYTPLTYAVYLNKPAAVRYLIMILTAPDPARKIKKEMNAKIASLIAEKDQLAAQKLQHEKAIAALKKNIHAPIEEKIHGEFLAHYLENLTEFQKLADKIEVLDKRIDQERAKIKKLANPYDQLFVTTKDGMNAYCLAKFKGHKEIMEILAPHFPDKTCPK